MTIVSKDILRWILVVTTYCGDITQKDLGTAGGPAYKYLFEIFDCLDQTGRIYRNEIRANLTVSLGRPSCDMRSRSSSTYTTSGARPKTAILATS